MSEWRRSRRCDAGTCVEVRQHGDMVEVRDSKDPDGPVLRFSREEWGSFISGVEDGEFRFFPEAGGV